MCWTYKLHEEDNIYDLEIYYYNDLYADSRGIIHYGKNGILSNIDNLKCFLAETTNNAVINNDDVPQFMDLILIILKRIEFLSNAKSL
jgi:hypothetical protein